MGRKALNRERKELTKKAKKWVKGLIPLLQDKDIENLTLDELVALMGKSKSTIYSYFSTKEEIYQTSIILYLEDMSFLVSPEAIEGEDMEKVFRSMLFKISEGLEGISIQFLEQIQKYFPESWGIVENFINSLLANFEKVYQKGMAQGTFRKFNLPLLLALDRHFVMSMITDSSQVEEHQMSLKGLVNEYLNLRMSALKYEI
ncbi:TetR/AcrR family transcriptional regulator [Algoriphagus sediminis]|uniref:TetR/AcrR family transcriptional regulator n=1 Tax=Algoriphagus sediminis TaxID=3057113 RepID=A0ABT7YDC9_9BACT|nr:TetR/AcrR family transcriptional regulator [Algoriphagus sediminis]MDN3204533.1 TetR/AcrR family transcriptional regulator [Algoriphagus sediminis]